MATSNNPGSSTNSPPDPSQSPSFKRWLHKAGLVTGLAGTKDEQMANLEEYKHNTCEKWKTELLNYSPAVTFMLKHLELSGCPVPADNIICTPCAPVRTGGFHPIGAIVLCQSHFMNKKHMEDTLTHELVHMYDHCKFKVDWNNLRHHACSEIRANSLSGDCRFTREIQRGFLAFSKQHQACVRRRAVMSVVGNPACPDQAAAERAVNEVWESCFNDTRPFDEVRTYSCLVILTFVVPLVSALTLNLPKDPITGGQTVLTWTANATDPPSFTIELDQASFHNALGIANNVATSAMTLTLELPSVPPGGGYTLQAVANGDINLVYSATSPFTISSPSTTGSTSVSVAKSSAKSTSSSSPS
ncbi:hypothetical protein PILCRDRAFT_71054 [Piloderma croceum F 1598]|uniref:Mitochondrial inner membrane protease ATP23 n=1 Tax=Piloderma croceum (strain F 1598) TaxID=765440 RepID=A0A0C3B7H8_PILCF|nr:hypothetical protein PILCRDRAFT_71054 [Piloderma croceum F 1598]